MRKNQLDILLTASMCRSFSEAASRCFTSVASVSRAISTLEDELGFELFVRDSHRLSLTEAGKVYCDGMRKVKVFYDDFVDEARSVAKGISGTLSVCILEGQMFDPVTRRSLSDFEAQHPRAKLELSVLGYGGQLSALDSGKIDLMLTIDICVEGQVGLEKMRICDLETKLVLPQSHPLARRRGLSLADFKHELFLTCGDATSGEDYMKAACRPAGFEPRVSLAPDLQTQRLWLEAGRGVAVANPNHMMCNSPALTEVGVAELNPHGYVAVWHKGNVNPLLESYLSILASTIARRDRGDSI